MEGMVVCSANHVPLTPISFLERAAFVYGRRVSMVFGDTRYLWKETHERCIKLASALCQFGITRGDVVCRVICVCVYGLLSHCTVSEVKVERKRQAWSVMQCMNDKAKKDHLVDHPVICPFVGRPRMVAAVAPNIPELYELQFGVPMAGAVLSALNPKLNATTLAIKLQQLEAKAIFVDYEFTEVVLEALGLLSQTKNNSPLLILIQENHTNPSSATPNNFRLDYHTLLAMGNLDFNIIYPKSECDPISICFTSGSTGKPKGVIYSHRAAYLNSMGEIFRTGMRQKPVFLWTVDMFRCNGWCFPWTMAAMGGTNICLRDVTGPAILNSIFLHNVTLFCGPPILLSKIAETLAVDQQPLPQQVDVIVAGAGALPEPQIQMKLGELGFNVIYGYGMSEALGPVTSRIITKSCHGEMSQLEHEDARTEICEGTHNLIMEGVDVKHPTTMESVPADGKTIGEVMFRSNALMSGYLKNVQATEEAFKGGWYRTKDLGVKHPDGSIEMKDRAVDVIYSRGETVSSLEIEGVIGRHPMVSEVAVVGRPDEFLGETPCAFVKLKEGCCIVEKEIIDFCATHLPENMRPDSVFFGELPVNSTGKVQKFVLRDRLINGNGKSL